jgi:hypothetical protein
MEFIPTPEQVQSDLAFNKHPIYKTKTSIIILINKRYISSITI